MRLQKVEISKKFIVGALVFILLSVIYQLHADLLVPTMKLYDAEPEEPGMMVVIDPGHGGADPGAVVGKTREADINMQLAKALRKLMESAGFQVVMTRSGDWGLVPHERMTYADQVSILQQRKDFAAEMGGQLFISLHANSNQDTRVSGGIVYYTGASSRPLALMIQQSLNQVSGKSWQPVEKDFSITKGNKMPSVLVEAAFLTNRNDREILTTKPEVLAQAIFAGIEDFVKNTLGEGGVPD